MHDFLPKSPFDVARLGRAPLGEPSFLPASGGVYLAIDTANRVWYVGKAESSIRERLAGHEKLTEFKEKEATLIAWQTEADEERCSQLEKAAIEHFHPPLNFQHNFNELPRAAFGLSPDEEIERFFQLRINSKIIELELAALEPNIVTHCQQAGGKITHLHGTLWYQTVPSWKYSEECEEQKQQLLQRQKQERESKVASVKAETTSPRYKLNSCALAPEFAIRLAPFLEERHADAIEAF
jgi:hypothetical protein